MSTVATTSWRAFLSLVRIEFRLNVREPTGLVVELGAPVLLVVVFGSIPTFQTAQGALGGLSPLDLYGPILMSAVVKAIPAGVIGVFQRRFEPPLDVQHHPDVVGVRLHGLDQQIMVDAVEERLDVQIEHPVLLPTPRPGDRDRVQRGTPRTVAVGVWVEHRLHLHLQSCRYHRLGDPVRDRGHTQHPDATISLRNWHRAHRRREVGPRGHPVPDPVQIVLQVGLERLDGLPIHSRCTLVGLDSPIRLPHFPLRNIERLPLRH